MATHDAERVRRLLLTAIASPRWFSEIQFALRRAIRVQRALWPRSSGGYAGEGVAVPASGPLRALPLQFAGLHFGQWLAPVDDPLGVGDALAGALSLAFALAPTGFGAVSLSRTRRFMHTINNRLNAIAMQVDVAAALLARAHTADASAYISRAVGECARAGQDAHAFALRLRCPTHG